MGAQPADHSMAPDCPRCGLDAHERPGTAATRTEPKAGTASAEGEKAGTKEKAGLGVESRLPLLLKVEEVAELLRTTKKAIYTMIDRAQLPGVVRVGRRVLVRRAALLEWLERSGVLSPEVRR